MKSLQRRFNNIVEKNPYMSTSAAFALAIMGQKFSRQIIHRWFNKLVDKDDYSKSEKTEILHSLEKL